jgi:hypothetical protein
MRAGEHLRLHSGHVVWICCIGGIFNCGFVALELGQRRKEAGHLQSATLPIVSGVAALGARLMARGTALGALVLVPQLAAPLLSEW